jgi:hypothetical protein
MPAFRLRLPDQLRVALDEAAANSGSSLNHEIVRRLQASFDEQDVLDQLLRDQSFRTMALLMIMGLKRGGERGAEVRGHPEWTPEDWLTDSFAYRVAAYTVMDTLGIGEPPEQLPQEPTPEEFRAAHKAYSRAVAAGADVTILPYPHPRERKSP